MTTGVVLIVCAVFLLAVDCRSAPALKYTRNFTVSQANYLVNFVDPSYLESIHLPKLRLVFHP